MRKQSTHFKSYDVAVTKRLSWGEGGRIKDPQKLDNSHVVAVTSTRDRTQSKRRLRMIDLSLHRNTFTNKNSCNTKSLATSGMRVKHAQS